MDGSAALVFTGFLMGLAGSPHCAGMCGAACAGLTRFAPAGPTWRAWLVFHLARASSYALGGALAAGSLAVLKAFGEQAALLRPFWVLAQVGALVLGLWLLWQGRTPRWPARPLPALQVVYSPEGRRPRRGGLVRVGALGALWVGWPCGLLQSALLVATLAPGPAAGAAVMLAFAAASAAALSWGLWLWPRTAGGSGSGGAGAQRTQALGVRVSGMVLAASAAWSLARGVQTAMGFC